MLKESQNYETSGQLLLSRLFEQQSCDFGTETSVPSDLTLWSEVASGQRQRHKNMIMDGYSLGFTACHFLTKSIRNSLEISSIFLTGKAE